MKGELRVLLTKRSRTLRSFSGDVSFPGGKADYFQETFESVARREAEEEIGLRMILRSCIRSSE
ncbi:CRL_G0038580.mRNA.1.CDS.1 [Saccharomyces cerevisiae]|nr:CRL_G0038580.mRNA.1.CDS.1 [Saccharomyces cerevisiae]CAI7415218.1 CRL_G0038580.mRNA.1.CDS.1 [Saccharomyces cerevisiae]